MGSSLQEQLLLITKEIEKQVDNTLGKIKHLDVCDLGLLKATVKKLNESEEKKRQCHQLGRGTYEQLPEEKMFFEIINQSQNVIVHFFTNTAQNTPIMDRHLQKLAAKHPETRFIKIDAEKCSTLVENLKIETFPALALMKNGIMVNKVVSYTQLGNRDDFSTDMLEWHIARYEMIEYEGDVSVPPQENRTSNENFNNVDDDDDEVDESTSLDWKVNFRRSSCSGVSSEKMVGSAMEYTSEEQVELDLDDDKNEE